MCGHRQESARPSTKQKECRTIRIPECGNEARSCRLWFKLSILRSTQRADKLTVSADTTCEKNPTAPRQVVCQHKSMSASLRCLTGHGCLATRMSILRKEGAKRDVMQWNGKVQAAIWLPGLSFQSS